MSHSQNNVKTKLVFSCHPNLFLCGIDRYFIPKLYNKFVAIKTGTQFHATPILKVLQMVMAFFNHAFDLRMKFNRIFLC